MPNPHDPTQPTEEADPSGADSQIGHSATLADDGLDDGPNRTRGPKLGDRIGHYHVLEEIGSGAMGTVIEAYDEQLDRRVALKLLHDRRRSRSNSGRQERRLLREAQALARLSHPNVVQVYEIGEAAGGLFIAMELILGQTLEEWQKEDRTWREVVDVYIQAGRGLAGAHAQGLIHRDFKPSNCIIDDAGQVKVLDFGLARESGDSSEVDDTLSSTDHSAIRDLLADGGSSESNRVFSEALTRTGALLGTPAYMAPEQLRGGQVAAHSDQFNFCVALYEGLYGCRPFPHDSIGELVNAVLGGNLRSPPPGSKVPGSLFHVLRRGLQCRPRDRWPSMEELLERLEGLRSRRTQSRWLVAMGLAAAATGGVLWGQADTTPPCRGAEARMGEVWGQPHAQIIDEALLDTGVPYAHATSIRVRDLLDTYAKSWIALHTETCEATAVHEQQSAEVLDLRMRCLESRRTAMLRTIELLEDPDASVVENAVAMASSLPRLELCNDVAALEAAVPPADDPAVATEVEALRDQLARATALAKAHHDEEMLVVVEPVLERALVLGYTPLIAEARLGRGIALKLLGRYPEARVELLAAFEKGVELGHDEIAMHASQELTFLVGHELAQREAGLAWGSTAEAFARRLDPQGPQHAKALRSVAIVQIQMGQIDAAAQRFEQALHILESNADTESLALARALSDMGNLSLAQSDLDAALDYYHRANALRLDKLGKGHPQLSLGELNLGHVYEAKDNLEAAAASYERALSLRTAAHGPVHPDTAIAMNNLAVVYDKQGKPDLALELHRRALDMRVQTLGPDHLYVAHSNANIGLALRAKGEHEEALPYFQRAYEIAETIGGREIEHALFELSEAELRLGRVDAARAKRERYLELIQAHEDDRSSSLAFAEFGLARVQWIQGEHEAATALLERAVTHSEASEDHRAPALLRDIAAWKAENLQPEDSGSSPSTARKP
ncbi:MAG: serine/threonine-protein kinase [Myxococcota bacterium]